MGVPGYIMLERLLYAGEEGSELLSCPSSLCSMPHERSARIRQLLARSARVRLLA